MNQMKSEMRLVTNESRTTSFDMVSHPTMPFPTQKTSTKPVNHLDGRVSGRTFIENKQIVGTLNLVDCKSQTSPKERQSW